MVERHYAAVKVAQTMPSKEECASDMGRRSNDAAVKDVQSKLRTEEYALGMGQRKNDMNALLMDVQNKLGKEECA